MEFDFTSLAFGGEQHIIAWDAKRIGALKPEDQQNLAKVLDVFGKKSAVAQGLQTPVTDIHRLRTTDQRLYLYMYRQSTKTVTVGGLKVGTKRLYVRTTTAELREIEPICVLDFYVHESCQRQGVGKALFEHFLNTEGCDPACLAYDRPSPKLLAFLRKHYGLQEFVPQSNNYVVFNRYFELNPTSSSTSRSQGRLSSRGSVMSGGRPNVHPLHGSRATMPLSPSKLVSQMPPAQVSSSHQQSWSGMGSTSSPSQSTVAPPQPVGNTPSFGRRWAANNFGSGPVQESAAAAATFTTSDGEAGTHGRSLGDSLDAFSREHVSGSPCQLGHAVRQSAPWDGQGAAAQLLPGSRSGYSTRPPWAVDDTSPSSSGLVSSVPGASMATPSLQGGVALPIAKTPQSVERLGTGTSTAARGPLQSILKGGGGRDGGGGGPHTRALQQQVAALQLSEGGAAGGSAYSTGSRAAQTPPPQQQPWASIGTPATGSRLGSSMEESAAAGRSTARIMAVAQRSGAGAADCLVW